MPRPTFTRQDRQFAMGVLALVAVVVLTITEHVDATVAISIIAGILAFYGYGEAQLKRDPPR